METRENTILRTNTGRNWKYLAIRMRTNYMPAHITDFSHLENVWIGGHFDRAYMRTFENWC